ncbi:MAG TPA: hypothetical protein VEC15_12655 [Actinomycetota bacterium]|nr:hypothetical protein [Actinomycetota bacterium]
MAEASVRDRAGERVVVPFLCTSAGAAIAVASWRILERDAQTAGWIALAAGAVLVAAGVLLQPNDRTARVVLSFADRAFDGLLLGALAWVTRSTRPSVAAGALIALAAGFLASYIRAKGGSLGYGVEEGVVTPVIRYVAFAVALLADAAWAIWTIAVVNLLAAVVRASQVAKEERT